jgi:hypothetical protein
MFKKPVIEAAINIRVMVGKLVWAEGNDGQIGGVNQRAVNFQ